MRIKALSGHSSAVLPLFFLLAGAAWAQSLPQPCDGALIPPVEGPGPATLGSATGCGVLITVTAVDGSGHATAFTVTIPNGGNGNPYDQGVDGDNSDDTLVGIQNNSGGSLTSITLTSPNLT